MPESGCLLFFPDILVSQGRFRGNEIPHQADALPIIQDHQHHSPRAEAVFRSPAGGMFTDHNPGDFVQQGCAAAHVAG